MSLKKFNNLHKLANLRHISVLKLTFESFRQKLASKNVVKSSKESKISIGNAKVRRIYMLKCELGRGLSRLRRGPRIRRFGRAALPAQVALTAQRETRGTARAATLTPRSVAHREFSKRASCRSVRFATVCTCQRAMMQFVCRAARVA